jgi:hypothetical protein
MKRTITITIEVDEDESDDRARLRVTSDFEDAPDKGRHSWVELIAAEIHDCIDGCVMRSTAKAQALIEGRVTLAPPPTLH